MMPAAHLVGETLEPEKENSVAEVLLHQHATSEMAIMTTKQIKQPSELTRQKPHPVPRTEASERAEGDRAWGPGRQTALRCSSAGSPQVKR